MVQRETQEHHADRSDRRGFESRSGHPSDLYELHSVPETEELYLTSLVTNDQRPGVYVV